MSKRFVGRLAAAVLIYLATGAIVSALHDYPQFLGQLRKFRDHDAVAERRPWLSLFYFVNEAGGGIKFFLTGAERHLAHYPSPSHLLAARLARARRGDWEAELLVGQMRFFGEGAPPDRAEGLRWMRLARDHAPPEHQAAMAALVAKAEAAENRRRAANQPISGESSNNSPDESSPSVRT